MVLRSGIGLGDRKSRFWVSGSIGRSRSSGCRVLPCVNVTIIRESEGGLIDEEVKTSEGWAAEKAREAALCTGRMRNERHGGCCHAGLVCFGSNLVCCSFCFGCRRGNLFPHSAAYVTCKEIEDEHRGLDFTAGGTRAHRTSTLTVYFDPNVTKINFILAQPRGVWIGLHQGSRKIKKIRPSDWSRVLVSDFRVLS